MSQLMTGDELGGDLAEAVQAAAAVLDAEDDPVRREQLARQVSQLLGGAQQELRRVRSAAVREVRADGATVRSAGLLLGISHTMTHRLAAAQG